MLKANTFLTKRELSFLQCFYTFFILCSTYFPRFTINRKKEGTAEKLHETRQDLQLLEEEVAEKRERVRAFAGETILRGEDFKRYVNQLRGKSNVYKVRQYLHLIFLAEEGGVCVGKEKY